MVKNWHTLAIKEIFFETKSSPEGLNSSDAAERIKKYGRNTLPQEKPYPKIRIFLNQFNSPLMFILLATVLISFLLKHYSDSIFIIIVLLINTAVGFYQENKANRSILALKKLVKIKARVLRDGNLKEIDNEELAIGDVVLIKPGDKVPADGRIIESKNLKIDEASLTGEWQAVEKEPAEGLAENTPLGEQTNMAFMGTLVEDGWAKIIIVSTGLSTQFGEIISLLKRTRERRTPLQQKLLSLSKLTGAFIVFLVLIIIGIGYFTEKSFADVFVASLALAVSAIPEGLLPAITVILVLGMRRILKQKGLVRKLVANETLGSVTVICTDKTGTLTEGKMQVSHILTSTKELLSDNVNGWEKIKDPNGIESHILALKIATLANEAFIENPEEELQKWIVRGRPTERALLLAGLQAGLSKKDLENQFPLIDKISFDSNLKYAAALRRLNEKENVFYIIGAPEQIISHSSGLDEDGIQGKLDTEQAIGLLKKLEELAARGLRVLACAYRHYDSSLKYQNPNELIKDLTLVGFIALKDPLRQEAKEAVATTKKAGIRTIIVTGDHKLTAQTIAQELEFEITDELILEGKDLEKISEQDLKTKAKNVLIYARVSPHHKLKIVEALQANGEVVAMIGDGINDAPALKKADIGIALGSGTDVAKEVADLVLLDDNFKTVVSAVEQGRVIFTNIRKVFTYLVADDFAELFLFLTSISLGFPLPLLPAQILWINLIEDGFPDIALTTEQETEGVMEEKPRNPKESILNKPLRKWMAAVFIVTGMAAFVLFFIVWKLTDDIERTRTFVFTLTAVDSLIFAFCVRSFKKPIFRKDIFSNRYLVGATIISLILLLGALHFPPLQKLLSTQPLGIFDWLVVLGVSLIEILLIEFFKKKFFTKKS